MHALIALAVVLDDKEHLLLVRSARRANRWELPGGKVESEESPRDAVVREVFEETGIALHSVRLSGLYWGTKDGLLRLLFVGAAGRARRTRGFRKDEILEVGWFPPDELPRPMPTLARRMIDDARLKDPPRFTSVDNDSELS